MTIEINRPELEALIQERLQSGFFHDVDELLTQALTALDEKTVAPVATGPEATSRRHISDVFRNIMSDIPVEVWETMPTDGASEHDHYIYGWPKKKLVKAVFADTFYWIALTLPRDTAYAQAQGIEGNIVTTDEVLTEYLTFFARAPQHLRSKAALGVRAALQDLSVRIIPQSRETFLLGVELYSARPDKGYSLTDCISMQTMRREGLTSVLTNDRHFEQEGFRALFRS